MCPVSSRLLDGETRESKIHFQFALGQGEGMLYLGYFLISL
jgi:hypothetical protein